MARWRTLACGSGAAITGRCGATASRSMRWRRAPRRGNRVEPRRAVPRTDGRGLHGLSGAGGRDCATLMPDILLRPWPWYVAGPLIGLFAPLLLWLGNRLFGVSSNLRHLCSAIAPRGIPYLSYDWRREGGWNLAFVAGIVVGGVLAGLVFRNPQPVAIAATTRASL